MAKNRIGKGLGALMGATIDNSIFDENKETAEKPLKEEYKEADKELEIKKIHTARAQARTEFDEDKLEELASSIREHGVLQPLLVRETDGKIELIAGERRLRAAKKAGLKKVPVIYLTADHDKAAEMGLIENIQREDLNAMEEAAAYREMIDVHHHTQETLAKVLGKSRSYVANTLRLLTLDEQIKEYIKTGKLTAGHGRALLSVKAEPRRQQLLEKILKDELSVRQAEEAAKALNEVSVKKEKSVKETAESLLSGNGK